MCSFDDTNDNPLYNLRHGVEDLPLDPIKPILKERLNKLRHKLPASLKEDYYHDEVVYDTHGREEDAADGAIPLNFSQLIRDAVNATRFQTYRKGLSILQRRRNMNLEICNRNNPIRLFGFEASAMFKERGNIECEYFLKRTKEFLANCIVRNLKNKCEGSTAEFSKEKISAKRGNPRVKFAFVNGNTTHQKQKQIECSPVHPDDQRLRAMMKFSKECQKTNAYLTQNAMNLKQRLLGHISVNDFQSFPTKLIMRSLRSIDKVRAYLNGAQVFVQQQTKKLPTLKPEIALAIYLLDPANKIREREATMLIILLINLQEEFRFHVKSAVIEMLTRHHQSKTLFHIEKSVPNFPLIVIKSPVPWSASLAAIRDGVGEKIMIAHPIVRAVRSIGHEMLENYIICTQLSFKSKSIQAQPFKFFAIVDTCCKEAKEILLNIWLPRVAGVVDGMIKSDRTIMSKKYCIQLYRCLHSLMSRQVQDMIQRSLTALLDLIRAQPWHREAVSPAINSIRICCVGKFGTDLTHDDSINHHIYIENEQDPHLLKEVNGHRIIIDVESGKYAEFIINCSGRFYSEPVICDLPDLVVQCFHKILWVGENIPRLEYFVSRDEKLHANLHCLRLDSGNIPKIFDAVETTVRRCTNLVIGQIYPFYCRYSPLLNRSMLNIVEVICEEVDNDVNPAALDSIIAAINELKADIFLTPDYTPVGSYQLDMTEIKSVITSQLNQLLITIIHYVSFINRNESAAINDAFEEIAIRASDIPKSISQFVQIQEYVNECRETHINNLKNRMLNSICRRSFLLTHTILSEADHRMYTRLVNWPAKIEKEMLEIASELTVVRKSFEEVLSDRARRLKILLNRKQESVNAFCRRPILNASLKIEEIKRNCMLVDGFVEGLNEFGKEAMSINIDENLLQMAVNEFPVLRAMVTAIEPVENLWKIVYFVEKNFEMWYYGAFSELNGDEVCDAIENVHKSMQRVIKGLADNKEARQLAEKCCKKINQFKMYVPILEVVCQKALTDQHWTSISLLLDRHVNPIVCPSLCSLIESGIMNIVDKLNEISLLATKEHESRTTLIQMQSEWSEIEFTLSEYKTSGTYVLTALDDICTLLDDYILKSQGMRSTSTAATINIAILDWESKLIQMQVILETWMQVQSMWIYLEPIFSSDDIKRQMPEDGRRFTAVNCKWKQIMRSVFNDKQVIRTTDYPNLLEILKQACHDLESIQKGLNSYLEKKRLFFARFFFLSNDELLEILSETKDPTRVQPHMKKCFEGINTLGFEGQQIINAMNSSDGEIVKLMRSVDPNKANGLVELWLKEIETTMLHTVQQQSELAYDNYWNSNRKQWVLHWPSQIVQLISCAAWTKESEAAIMDNQLTEYHAKCTGQIADIVELVRGQLTRAHTITIEALIVLDVHACDIIKILIGKNVDSAEEFSWISQLRYYCENGTMDVRMLSTVTSYAWEYLGNVTRLVVTPLTDRCYRTIMGAIKLNLGSAPEGPAGTGILNKYLFYIIGRNCRSFLDVAQYIRFTGKTETCKDLAKAVGKKCIVFNCSDGLDYKALGKFFKGIIQSGAWAVFDEFNRIELEVLSVIGQQILSIQQAIAAKVENVIFEDTNLSLDPTCNIFITMNPGYTGRTELPNNLKVLFRTVAMMVPDYSLIGEITLYSCGFNKARILAQKIVHTYKLCSEQLSSQRHYDYGMRAVKSVLLAAGTLRRKYPDEAEERVILKAIIDINLPKFVQQDVPLFEGIYRDLFPNVSLPDPDRDIFLKYISQHLEKDNLQATPWLIEKILQIYEMILVRHGLMVVGGTMAAKSVAWKTLAAVLGEIKKNPHSSVAEMNVFLRIINPKAISMDRLYGKIDMASQEWFDGVIAKTFREMVNSLEGMRKWIIFDGPVDAIWIENLNTLLDDNKKLCLMSGEIMEMDKNMSIMFETADLDQASPATVSRCGMVYMDPALLSWDVLHESYMQTLRSSGMNDTFVVLFGTLAAWLIPPVLAALVRCDNMLEVSGSQQYRLLGQFLTMHVLKQKQLSQIWYQQTFLFCFVWAFCSSLTNEGRKRLDPELRSMLHGSNSEHPKPKQFTLTRGQIFPEKFNFMDYYFDGIDMWRPWFAASKEFSIAPNIQVSDIIVPTKETGYILHWLNICVSNQIPLSLIGPTGTGKSAIIVNFMRNLDQQKNILNVINFSARTTSSQTQHLILSKLDKRRKGVFGPPLGKSCLIFFDDVAMPSRDTYGSQPALELLRQWMDGMNWYDQDAAKIHIVDTNLNTAMGLIGGNNYIYPRFYRHTFVLSVDSFENSTLTHIFASITNWHFSNGFDADVSQWANALASAMSHVYLRATICFLPTPEKMHYAFSLRDITRIFQGIVQVPRLRLTESNKLIRLWIHETYRTFHDRLINNTDRNLLFELISEATHDYFRIHLEEALENYMPLAEPEKSAIVTNDIIGKIIYGSFMDPDERVYDEILDLSEMENVVVAYLAEYNAHSRSPMNLIMFRYALEHLARVCRILNMPRGNILLVGMGGSGRRSSVKLAASIMNADLIQLEIGQNYSLTDWRDDMKKILMNAGLNAKVTVLLLSDVQLRDETFIDDINSLLNAADIPNLYAQDDISVILEAMQNAVDKKMHGNLSPLTLYAHFTERVRTYLHIALVFSPIGDSFRTSLRNYPSIINCCTIDWFQNWPEDALFQAARSFIVSMALDANVDVDINVDMQMRTSSDNLSRKSFQRIPAVTRQMSSDELNVTKCVLYIHKSIEFFCKKFYAELGRLIYVTPATYLELLHSIRTIYRKRNDEIVTSIARYTTGLEQLKNAAAQVAVMQEKLVGLQPELKLLSEEAEKIMVIVQRQTIEVTKRQEIISADEAVANEAAAAAQAIKDDCDNDLQNALPVLNAATAALDTLKPADITIVKSMKNPPALVKFVLEAVCVIRDIKPEKKADAKGKMTDDFWPASMRMLNDMKFIEILKNFDKDNITVVAMKKIRDKYITNAQFVPEKIKNVSSACEGLCKWVRAMEVYDRTAKIVGPKKLALAEAQQELDEQIATLESKRAELSGVMARVKELNDEYDEKSVQKQRLQDEINLCAIKLSRAESLINGLLGEKIRWQCVSEALHDSLAQVLGDVLLSSACVTYIGPYTIAYRHAIIDDWKKKCSELHIPFTSDYSLVQTLCSPIQLREWSSFGLPLDNFSQENGAILANASRYPLLIDPQTQAVKWIKGMEQKNNLKIIQISDDKYLRTLEHCVSFGIPVLIENVGETIDSSLFPVLERNVIERKGGLFINIGGNLVAFNSEFRLYITTCLSNPHYIPEISILVTLLNFVITEEGLQDQLLSDVIVQEKPELQQLKEWLVIESAQNKDMLFNLETKILEVLTTSGDNILEDEEAISILTKSKILSKEIEEKQVVAAKTGVEIDVARQRFMPIAQHASCLFFCITELSKLDSMYQFSIGWFTKLFISTLKDTSKTGEIGDRIRIVQETFGLLLYQNVSRTLFARHNLILAFVMCIGLLRLKSTSGTEDSQLEFLLADGSLFENPHANPAPDWLNNRTWDDIARTTCLPALTDFYLKFIENIDQWREYCELSEPEEVSFPEPFQLVQPLVKLIIIKCLRPDRLVRAIQLSIINEMGYRFVEPPIFDLSSSFKDSDPDTPIIFLLSSGSDPVSSIYEFAKQFNMTEKCYSVSLGQGQGPRAEKLIKNGREFGHWIILQNCHVATSWLRNLEMICMDKEAAADANEDFRLWCTSYPTSAFPISVLQKSITITNELPRNIKLNMLRSYATDMVRNDSIGNWIVHVQRLWHRGCFALIFFHAVILDRRDYGPIGWNIPYDFNESDLRISLQQLNELLKSYQRIPFEGHSYLTGECNYGGRVTDDRDRRLLLSLLNVYYNEFSVNEDNFKLSPDGTYRVPLNATIEECISLVSSYPTHNSSEVVGLHSNANITRNIIAAHSLLNGILLTQRAFIRIGAASGFHDAEDPVLLLSNDISNRLPPIFDMYTILQVFPTDYTNSMNTVLQQEARRYNNLLVVIKSSLHDVQRAIKGEIAMIPTIENNCLSMSIGKLPAQWASKSYPSIKPLSSYVTDLVTRLEYLQSWIRNGEPRVFWLPGFYFTQSFITAILQNYARRSQVQIDLVTLKNEITAYENVGQVVEQQGVLIHGVYLEGARWDRGTCYLEDPISRILFDNVPILDMIAIEVNEGVLDHDKKETEYDAPLYQTTERRGTLSTTGHSTNFIMFLKFRSRRPIQHWINRGTAVFCQLND